jgi:hypothetical protein
MKVVEMKPVCGFNGKYGLSQMITRMMYQHLTSVVTL